MKTELTITIPSDFMDKLSAGFLSQSSLEMGGLDVVYEKNLKHGGGSVYLFGNFLVGLSGHDCTPRDVLEHAFEDIEIKSLLGLCHCGCDLTPLFLERLYKLHLKTLTGWQYQATFDIQDEIYLQLLDFLGWLEHGGSVYGSWLSDKGVEFVNTFISKEQQEEFILELAANSELPLELQQICLAAINGAL